MSELKVIDLGDIRESIDNGLVYDTDRDKIDTGIMFKSSNECEPIMNSIKVRKREDTDWHEPTVDYMGLEEVK